MPDYTGRRAVVIDDSLTVRQALGYMLRVLGFEVELCESGEAGLEQVRRHPPDLIFLDILLPGMNGFAIVRQLRKQPELSQMVIVMMSGNPQATEQFFLDRIGVDDFLPKPFGKMLIADCLQRLETAGRLPAPSRPAE